AVGLLEFGTMLAFAIAVWYRTTASRVEAAPVARPVQGAWAGVAVPAGRGSEAPGQASWGWGEPPQPAPARPWTPAGGPRGHPGRAVARPDGLGRAGLGIPPNRPLGGQARPLAVRGTRPVRTPADPRRRGPRAGGSAGTSP